MKVWFPWFFNFFRIFEFSVKQLGLKTKLDCILGALSSSAEFALFIQSNIVLTNTTVFKTLVQQDLPVAFPMLQLNQEPVLIKHDCYMGWNKTIYAWIDFSGQKIESEVANEIQVHM